MQLNYFLQFFMAVKNALRSRNCFCQILMATYLTSDSAVFFLCLWLMSNSSLTVFIHIIRHLSFNYFQHISSFIYPRSIYNFGYCLFSVSSEVKVPSSKEKISLCDFLSLFVYFLVVNALHLVIVPPLTLHSYFPAK